VARVDQGQEEKGSGLAGQTIPEASALGLAIKSLFLGWETGGKAGTSPFFF
jgi:hypothetical protein